MKTFNWIDVKTRWILPEEEVLGHNIEDGKSMVGEIFYKGIYVFVRDEIQEMEITHFCCIPNPERKEEQK